jgi:hypothetical protein
MQTLYMASVHQSLKLPKFQVKAIILNLGRQIFSKQIKNDACDVTLSVYPHRASLKNMPVHGGNRTYDLWNTSPMDILRTQSNITSIIFT